jgi:hypothetical protein
MSLIWMPAHTTVPPRATALSASGTRAPSGAKMMAASSAGAHVARPNEGEHPATLETCRLHQDVRGEAEPVEAKPDRIACHAKSLVANEASTEKGTA